MSKRKKSYLSTKKIVGVINTNIKTSIFKIAILLLALILLNNCELYDENADLDSTFIIGYDNGFVDITTFGTGEGKRLREFDNYQNSYNSAGFDIDKDSVIDFYLTNNYTITHFGSEVMKASIRVSNTNFKISVIEMTDTIRQCIQPVDDSINYIESYFIYNTDYSCDGNRIDTILSAEINFYPKIYSIGDTLTHKESWLSENFYLAYRDYSKLWGRVWHYSVVLGNWVDGENNKCILFKKDVNGTVLYGWFRLNTSRFCDISLYEYAIQKTNIE